METNEPKTDTVWVAEAWINASRGQRIGEHEPQDTGHDDIGYIYRASMREYGRCTGRVYVDRDGKPTPVGWTFVRRVPYTDCITTTGETYLQEVWVTLHAGPCERRSLFINARTGMEV